MYQSACDSHMEIFTHNVFTGAFIRHPNGYVSLTNGKSATPAVESLQDSIDNEYKQVLYNMSALLKSLRDMEEMAGPGPIDPIVEGVMNVTEIQHQEFIRMLEDNREAAAKLLSLKLGSVRYDYTLSGQDVQREDEMVRERVKHAIPRNTGTYSPEFVKDHLLSLISKAVGSQRQALPELAKTEEEDVGNMIGFILQNPFPQRA